MYARLAVGAILLLSASPVVADPVAYITAIPDQNSSALAPWLGSSDTGEPNATITESVLDSGSLSGPDGSVVLTHNVGGNFAEQRSDTDPTDYSAYKNAGTTSNISWAAFPDGSTENSFSDDTFTFIASAWPTGDSGSVYGTASAGQAILQSNAGDVPAPASVPVWVPEPCGSTLILTAVSLFGMGGYARRHRPPSDRPANRGRDAVANLPKFTGAGRGTARSQSV